jgi:hypothetical protein
MIKRYTKGVLVFNVRARGYQPRRRSLADAKALKFSVNRAVKHRLKEIVQAAIILIRRN